MESYKILAAWDRGVRTEEEWLADQGMEEEKGEEQELQLMLETETEEDIQMQNRKRKQFVVYFEEGFEQPPPYWCSLFAPMSILLKRFSIPGIPTNMVSMVCLESATNMVSMVCLESATILAPSMFGTQLLSDSTNVFQRRIFVGDVQQGNP